MQKIFRYRFWLALTLVLALSLGVTGTALAFEFIENGNLPAGETIDDDLFIVGDTVTIDGTVNGDLFAFGRDIVVNGQVNGSLAASGQTVTVNGDIAGSVYAGSSATTLGAQATIGRNLYFGGFSLEVLEGATIGRDLAVGGYQAILAGEVRRDVYAGAGALEISGVVDGDVKAEVDSAAGSPMPFEFFLPPGVSEAIRPGLRVAEDAQIGGTLDYTSPADQSANIRTDPEEGILYSTPTPEKEAGKQPSPEVGAALRVGRWFLQRLRELVTLLALGALVLWLVPGIFEKVVRKATDEPLPATGWGLLTIVAGYAGAAILAALVLALGIFFGVLTLGGLWRAIVGVGFSSLGLVMALFVLLVTYGSKLVISFWGGRWILGQFAPQAAATRVWPLVMGVVVYVLLRAIPFLGWIIGVVVTLIGMGAMWLTFREWRTPQLAETGAAG